MAARQKCGAGLPREAGDEFYRRAFENDVVVLYGAMGCGKTTQLPQMLMKAAAKTMHERRCDLGENGRSQFGTGRIVCTQPRRISGENGPKIANGALVAK